MNRKRWLGVLLLALGLTSPAMGQSAPRTPYASPPPLIGNGSHELPAEAFLANTGGLSDWIVYRRECCEGRHGRVTPLSTEIYTFAGPSIPVGGQLLSRELQTGWSIGIGAKALFFNERMTDAWVIGAHILNTHQDSANTGNRFPLTVFRAGTREDFGTGGTPGVTVDRSDRTMVGIGLGREHYPWRPADSDGKVFRFGYDFGGRYGTHNLRTNETRGIKDVIGGMYAGIHGGFEVPYRSVLLYAGGRCEWAYTFSDILHRTSDVQDLSVFLTGGIRY